MVLLVLSNGRSYFFLRFADFFFVLAFVFA